MKTENQDFQSIRYDIADIELRARALRSQMLAEWAVGVRTRIAQAFASISLSRGHRAA